MGALASLKLSMLARARRDLQRQGELAGDAVPRSSVIRTS
jgi:hypothetical protein